ncbi:MAG TPA: hypothetical protein VL307_10170 [Chitinophagaceae bacterium]|nr:hypothetical protein [Chitinophagaceae bacterium]
MYATDQIIQEVGAENWFFIQQDQQYLYKVKEVIMSNLLGNGIVAAYQYKVRDAQGNQFTLYKIKDGNWYDVANENSHACSSLLSRIKWSIDVKERMDKQL